MLYVNIWHQMAFLWHPGIKLMTATKCNRHLLALLHQWIVHPVLFSYLFTQHLASINN